MRHIVPSRLGKSVLMIAVWLTAVRMVSAQTGGGVDLSWHLLSSGGASASSGGAVTLGGSLGQFGAGTSSGATAALAGGFWNANSGGVLAATLADFSAVQQGDFILLTWETNSELGNRGFNLYRGVDPAGPDRQLNATLIPSQSPGSPSGFIYTWEDRADLTPGTTYTYWVEDVDISGAATMHGPVSATYQVPTAVTLAALRTDRGAGSLPWAAAMAAVACAAALLAVRKRVNAP